MRAMLDSGLGLTPAFLRDNERATRRSTAFPPEMLARGKEMLCSYDFPKG